MLRLVKSLTTHQEARDRYSDQQASIIAMMPVAEVPVNSTSSRQTCQLPTSKNPMPGHPSPPSQEAKAHIPVHFTSPQEANAEYLLNSPEKTMHGYLLIQRFNCYRYQLTPHSQTPSTSSHCPDTCPLHLKKLLPRYPPQEATAQIPVDTSYCPDTCRLHLKKPLPRYLLTPPTL